MNKFFRIFEILNEKINRPKSSSSCWCLWTNSYHTKCYFLFSTFLVPDEHKGKLNWTFNTCNLRVWQGFSDSKAKLHFRIYICTEMTPGVDHILCQALARGAQFLAGWVIERKEWPHWHPGEDCTQAPCRGSSVNTTWRVAKTMRINLAMGIYFYRYLSYKASLPWEVLQERLVLLSYYK